MSLKHSVYLFYGRGACSKHVEVRGQGAGDGSVHCGIDPRDQIQVSRLCRELPYSLSCLTRQGDTQQPSEVPSKVIHIVYKFNCILTSVGIHSFSPDMFLNYLLRVVFVWLYYRKWRPVIPMGR